MISLIICSRKRDISIELKKNISSTIGIDYELIVINNTRNNYSIFPAYKKGMNLANGEIFCYMHDDIFYRNNNWGRNVELYLHDYKEVGMLGVIGTHFMPVIPASWWDTEINSGQILQWEPQSDNQRYIKFDNCKSTTAKVSAIDEVWMCIPKKCLDLYNGIP